MWKQHENGINREYFHVEWIFTVENFGKSSSKFLAPTKNLDVRSIVFIVKFAMGLGKVEDDFAVWENSGEKSVY